MNRTVKTLVYCRASKIDEYIRKEYITGKFQLYGRKN